MLIDKIILLSIIVSFYICYCCISNTSRKKHETASLAFLRIRSEVSTRCQYINNDFDKLKGFWYYILRTVAPKTPTIHCGRFFVWKTSENGFESRLIYLTDEGDVDGVPITAEYLNETVVKISELDKLITANTTWEFPFIVQMGICDKDTLFFVEPVYYHGGGMVFTRYIPDSVNGLKLRFGTYDEDRGIESTVRVDFNCITKRDRYALNSSVEITVLQSELLSLLSSL